MNNTLTMVFTSTLLLGMLAGSPVLQAAEPTSPSPTPATVSSQEMAQQNAFDAASEAAIKTIQPDPTTIPLAGQATLRLLMRSMASITIPTP